MDWGGTERQNCKRLVPDLHLEYTALTMIAVKRHLTITQPARRGHDSTVLIWAAQATHPSEGCPATI